MALDQIILDYLKKPSTFNALLINAKWGAGKTYYWKKHVVPNILEKLHVPNSEKVYKEIYVSLYRLSSIQEVEEIVFWSLLGLHQKNRLLKSLVSIGSSVFLKAIPFLKMESEMEKVKKEFSQGDNLNNYVIVFDNLERIESDGFFQNVLGYINYLSEINGVKTIILTDEARLRKKYLEKWEMIKEKIVSHQIDFHPNYKVIIQQILDDDFIDKDYCDFLKTKLDLVIEVFKKSNTNNLRSLIYGLDLYSEIFFYSKKFNILKELSSELLYSSLAICFEFKKGKIDTQDYLYLGVLPTSPKINFKKFIATIPKHFHNSEKLNQFYSEFIEKYFEDRGGYTMTKSLFEYLTIGDSDILKPEEIIEIYSSKPDTTKQLKVLFAVLNMPNEALNQKEFDNYLNEILTAAERGDYELLHYPSIHQLLHHLHHSGLIHLESNQINDLIMKAIDEITNRPTFSFDESLEGFISSQNIDESSNKIVHLVIDKNKQAYQNKLRQLSVIRFDAMKDIGNFTGFFELQNEEDFSRIPVFEFFSPDEMWSFLKGYPSQFVTEFIKAVEQEKLTSLSSKEKKVLSVLKEKIDSEVVWENLQNVEIYYIKQFSRKISKLL